ncbi:MAG: 2Fe-2S iron-sulfur cluster-binding protein [Panacagrimonas sp.]
MPKVKFIQHDGSEQVIDAQVGQSVMEAATSNFVDGIVGDCGGCCSCATCHVYVEPEWFDRLDPRDEMEDDMLEGALDPQDNSRLSCQIKLSEALDGITVRVPESQY